MGFFDLFTKKRDAATDGPKLPRDWSALEVEGRVAYATALVERIVALTGATDAKVVMRDSDIEIRGQHRGRPCRVKLDTWGSVELELKNGGVELSFMDINFDRDKLDAPPAPPPDEAWDKSEQVTWLAPGISIDGSSADEETAQFRALAPALQARLLATMPSHGIRLFRSRPEQLEIDLTGKVSDHPDPATWIAEVLMLGSDVTDDRVARPAARRNAPRATPLPGDDPMVPARALARALVARVPGATVVERVEDAEVDVRWTEHGMPVQILLDAAFDDVDLAIRCDDQLLTFELSTGAHEPEAPGPDDPWARADETASLSPTVFLTAAARPLRRQVALLRALPAAELAALSALVDRVAPRSLSLDDERLMITWCDLTDLAPTDGAAIGALIDAARELAGIAAQLGRDTFVHAAAAPRCPACHTWIVAPAGTTRCPRCDAPAPLF